MEEEDQIELGEMKPLNAGYTWADVPEDTNYEQKKEKSNQLLIKILLLTAIILVTIILFQSESAPKTFVETFPNKEALEKKYNAKVITQIDVVTRAEAGGDNKILVDEIEKLMHLIRADLTAKGKSNEDINRDSLYLFCLENLSKSSPPQVGGL